MDILDWIKSNRPGEISDLSDRIEIAHASGEHSTLWKKKTEASAQSLEKLGELYSVFDGLDLFSSTFKIASINEPKSKNNVIITFTLNQLKNEVASLGCDFPEWSVPFLYQAGIGYCAINPESGHILECDSESGERSDEYGSIE